MSFMKKIQAQYQVTAYGDKELQAKFTKAQGDLDYNTFVGPDHPVDVLNIDSGYLIAIPKTVKVDYTAIIKDWTFLLVEVSIRKPDTNVKYYGNNAFIPVDKARAVNEPHKVYQQLEANKNKFLLKYEGKLIDHWEPK